jgi:DnaJ-class molecular chaperone
MPTHYETLGVNEDADEQAIKKAYRSLSFQYHPDRYNGTDANEKMHAINEAYEVLKDDEKREQYNNELKGIKPGFPGGFPPGFPPGFPGFNFFDMFMGGGGGVNIEIIHGPGGQTFIRRQQSKPPPIVKHLNISFEQSYSGFNTLVEVQKPDGSLCMLDVTVPKGANEGHIIPFLSQGHRINDQIVGDIHIVIHLEKHPTFIRKGDDLYFKKTLTLKEALCGTQFGFVYLNGKHISLTISNAVISPGSTKKFKGYGFNEQSDLIVEFDVEFPSSLSDEQRTMLQQCL